MPEAAAPTVGVVVLHHRNWPVVVDAIEAVLRQVPSPHHVVVVDNASEDGTADRIRGAFPGLDVVVASENRGYAAGMNLGARRLADDADPILFLTHDCVLEPGTLAALVERLATAPEVGFVGPLLVWADQPERVWSAGGCTEGANRRLNHDIVPAARSAWAGGGPRRVAWLDGACVLVRREAFDRLGGFDERFFLYLEEADLMLRGGAIGWRVECVPDAVARQSSAGLPVHLLARNRLLFVRRHAPWALPLETAQLLRQGLGFARRRHTRRAVAPALRGIVAGLLGRTGPVAPRLLAVRIDPEWREGLRLR